MKSLYVPPMRSYSDFMGADSFRVEMLAITDFFSLSYNCKFHSPQMSRSHMYLVAQTTLYIYRPLLEELAHRKLEQKPLNAQLLAILINSVDASLLTVHD